MYGSRSICIGLAVIFLASPGAATAQCQRTGSLICGSGAPRIASAAPLEVSRGGNFAALKSGSALKGGDRILVGVADATLSLGPSCQAAVGAGSLVSIRGTGGKTCASVNAQAGQMNGVVENDDKKTIDPFLVGGVAAGAAALAIGIALATSTSNTSSGGGTVSSR